MSASSIDLLCRLRFEVRDWQYALGGGREGLDDLCALIDAKIAEMGHSDGYRCPVCKQATIPHDSGHCPECGAADSTPHNDGEGYRVSTVGDALIIRMTDRRLGECLMSCIGVGVEGAEDADLSAKVEAIEGELGTWVASDPARFTLAG